MLRNKKDVDNHVRELLAKIKNENDRKSRGYNIARLYYSVNEYESARRYLAEFISMRPKASEGHKLMGQIYEKMGQKEKAVSSYKTSFTITQTQKDLIPKICELYSEIEADPSVRAHWVEEGERLFPHHNSIIKLRQSLMLANPEQSKDDLEKFYLKEIKANPLSLSLHIRLVKLLLDWAKEESAKYGEAYDYVIKVEGRRPFPRSLEWYETMVEVFKVYESWKDLKGDTEFEQLYLTIYDRYVFESLASSCGPALSAVCSMSEAAKRLQHFDARLCKSLQCLDADSEPVKHFIAQYYFHAALLLAIIGKTESILHKFIYMGSLLLHSLYLPKKIFGSSNTSEKGEIFKAHWHATGHYRVSQAGHLLNQLGQAYRGQKYFLNKILEMGSSQSTRKHMHKLLFSSEDGESLLLTDVKFLNGELKFLDEKVQLVCDQEVSLSCNNDLRELVWLYSRYSSGSSSYSTVKFLNFHFFRTIPFASSMNTFAPETLCHLDLISFIVATAYCHQANSDIYNEVGTSCPSILTTHLHTPEQGEWWNAAAALCSNAGSKRLNRLRSILQNGLECIRHLGYHILPLQLSVHLARYFTKCISDAKEEGNSSMEVDSLEERAEHYWTKIVAQCLKTARGSIGPSKSRLFEIRRCDLSDNDLAEIGEEGELFIADRLIAKGKREEAVQTLSRLKSPKASFNRAMLYKKEAQCLLGNRTWLSLSLNARNEYTDLLTRCRDALYLTLDRLKMPGVDPSDPLNAQLADEMTSIEHSLASVNVDDYSDDEFTDALTGNANIPLNLTNGNASTPNNWKAPQPLVIGNSSMFSTPNSTRINRQEARPSPERLDAQVRHLTEIQQNTIKNIEEHNAALRAQNKALLQTCQTMSAEFKENVAFYKNYIEQKNAAADHMTPLLDQMQQLQTSMKNLQLDVQTITADIKELKNLRSAQPKLEPVQLVTAGTTVADSQVPLEIASPIQGVYNNYMGFYGQQPMGSPLVPPTAVFNPCQPPFMPPSTLQDQTYMTPSTTTLIKSEPLSSSGLGASSLYQHGNVGLKIPQSKIEKDGGSSVAPPHSYQISLPPVSNALQFPPVPQALSISETSFNTEGLLSNVPAPLYSAITSYQSPEKGDNKNLLASSLTSTPVTPRVNLSGSANGLSASTFGQQSKSNANFPAGPSPAGNHSNSLETSKYSPTKPTNDSDHYIDDGHDPCPDFKPIIPLPEQVEVSTGEEDEKILFEGRAKLYRFVDREWKERGIGPLKVLHNEAQNTVRVLMRRDQTHKICCNHLISSNLELSTMKDNDKVWIWAAQDFADEKLTLEKFCCKFKTAELAQDFHKAFYKGKSVAENAEKTKKDTSVTESPTTGTTGQGSTAEIKSLSEIFKPEEGSWNCPSCLVVNKKEASSCVSCQTYKPGGTQISAATSTSSNDPPKVAFKFGVQSSSDTSSSATLTFLGDKSISKSSLSFIGTPSSKSSIIFGSPSSTNSSFKASPLFGTSSALTLGPTSSVTISALKPGETPSLSLFKTNSQSPGAVVLSAEGSEVSSTTAISSSKQDSDNGGKFSMEGFTFSSVPNISVPKQEVKLESEAVTKTEPKKESIFSNFSFSSSKSGLGGDSKNVFSFNLPSDASKTTLSSTVTSSTQGLGGFSILSNVAKATTTTASSQPSGGLFWEMKSTESVTSFSALAASDKSDKPVFVTKDPKAFEPKPLFGKDKGSEPHVSGVGDTSKEEVDEYEPQVDFKPVVPMPDLVEIKTGEEDEERIFCERAKLYRFDNDAKEWKERGIGEVKLLKNNSTSKVRLLMRRDQTHKVCANHFISRGMKLSLLPSSQTAWFWAANDFADEEMKMEKFAIKFKTQELAQKFSTVFEESQKNLPSESASPESTLPTPKSSEQSTNDQKNLSEMFKPAAGSWECQTCLVRNKEKDTSCLSCSTPKEGGKSTGEDNGSKSTNIFGGSTFSFKSLQNQSTNSAFKFGISGSATTSSIATTAATSINTPVQAFKFGITTNASTDYATSTTTTTTTSNQPLNFSWKPPADSEAKGDVEDSKGPSDGSIFSTPTRPADESKGTSAFAFGSPGKYEFKFSGVKASRSRDTSTCDESENGGEEEEEEEEDNLYFEPVVPLPEKVAIVTGEEKETPLFCHRAKLFRLKDGEFKERGLGDVKILEHNENQKIRLLMRREQVHKICLNHYLNADLEFREKDDKSFYWVATDFSELEPSKETFAIRFKTPEIAKSFSEAILEAQRKLSNKSSSKDESPRPEGAPSADDGKPVIETTDDVSNPPRFGTLGFESTTSTATKSLFSFGDKSSIKSQEREKSEKSGDVKVLYEKKATSDQIERARKLFLPDNFYLYENINESCPGCIGCDPEEYVFNKDVKKSSSEVKTPASTSTNSLFEGKKSFSIFGAKDTVSVASSSAILSFGNTGTTSISPSSSSQVIQPGKLFGSPQASSASVFGNSAATTKSIFGGSAFSAGYVFGGVSSITDTAGNIFGGISSATTTSGGIFSGVSPATSTAGSIFGGVSPAATTAGSIFGGVSPATTTAGSIFGGVSSTTTTTGNIFGGLKPMLTTTTTATTTTSSSSSVYNEFKPSSTTSPSIFAGSQTNSIFGGSQTSIIFGGSQTTTSSKPSLFGGSQITTSSIPSVFTGSSTNSSLFNSGSSSSPSGSFSALSSGALTYSELAKQSSSSAFTKSSSADSSAWVSKPVFGNNTSLDKSSEKVEDDYDPHYEPIIPMPELVEVTTGEEGWDELFSNRAKLYRYDTEKKEWKERGLGDFKIQYEPNLKRYRLLQRREKVHKLACNHALTASLKLGPMASSETSWCWIATDYSEDASGEIMKLAVKFKTTELANKFKEVFDACQQKLSNQGPAIATATSTATSAGIWCPPTGSGVASTTSTSSSFSLTTAPHDDDDDDDDDDDEEDDEYEDISESDECLEEEGEEIALGEEEEEEDDDDSCGDDQSVIFSNESKLFRKIGGNWQSLGSGTLRILYDDDVYGARIIGLSESEEKIVDNLIAIQTIATQEDELSVSWICSEEFEQQSPKKSQIKAIFETSEATKQFLQAFSDGKEFAFSSRIHEACNEVPEDMLYSGQASED